MEGKGWCLADILLDDEAGIVAFSLDRRYRYVDYTAAHAATMKKIWGREIYPGLDMLETIGLEEDRAKAKRNFDRALRGESFVLMEEYGSDELERNYYEDHYGPVYDEDGHIVGLYVYIMDITTVKRAEVSARRARQTNSAILEAIPDIVFIINEDYVFVDYHTSYAEILYRPPSEFIGKTVFEVLPDYLAHMTAEHIDETLCRNSKITYEYSLEIEGILRFYEARMVPKSGHEVLAIVRDVTERKWAELEFAKRAEHLRITLNSIGDAVIATDAVGRVVNMNPVAEKLTGYSEQEAKGRQLDEVFSIINQHSREPLGNPVDMVLRTGNVVGLANNTILISRSGDEYAISDSAAPIRDQNGDIRGVVLVFRDVTEKLRTELELQKLEKLESVGLLAGGIAHDFNNILLAIFGNLELAKMEIDESHPAARYLNTALKSLEKATHLTKQLLTFSKGGAPIIKSIDIKRLIGEVVNFNLSGSKIRAYMRYAKDLWPVKADKGQLSHVFANLTINAKEAMRDGGSITITAENQHSPEHPMVKLVFADEGVGIDPAYIDKIFDPYFTTKSSGSGLGLAIVHSIVTKHNGRIEVMSAPGEGTTFTIYLPADPGGSTVDDEEPARGVQPSPPKGYRVLFMDDDENVRVMAASMLRKCGYVVDFADDGLAAIDKYAAALERGEPFDVVIMDLTVRGGMGGKEALRKVLEIDPHAKVVVASGYSTDPVMAEYDRFGFKGRLVKPFLMRDVEEELARVLRS